MTHTLNLDAPEAHVFDAANWRPLNDKAATEALASIAMAANEPDVIGATVDVPKGWHVRLCFHAEVKPRPFDGVSQHGPYLMLLWDEERAKAVWLVRQDVDLALG